MVDALVGLVALCASSRVSSMNAPTQSMYIPSASWYHVIASQLAFATGFTCLKLSIATEISVLAFVLM
jgi:hypothetical protein